MGWLMLGLYSLPMLASFTGKITKSQEVVDMLSTNNLLDWITIIAIGQITSLVLFWIPKTMRLGAMLLCAYWGGAILFHMSNPVAEQASFLAPSVFFTMTLIISWLRGMELIDLSKKS